MAEKISRLAYLLGEMRREKNGAVADFMRFYGDKYGLNYGVSIPTIRAIAGAELSNVSDVAVNHKFAKLLYQQEVRELRLAAFYFADIKSVDDGGELDFWARGMVNSEVAEEAAFALFYRSKLVDAWLRDGAILLQYCAVMSLAKRGECSCEKMSLILVEYGEQLAKLVDCEPHIIPKAVVALIDSAINIGVESSEITRFLSLISKECAASKFIHEEVSWRLEFR